KHNGASAHERKKGAAIRLQRETIKKIFSRIVATQFLSRELDFCGKFGNRGFCSPKWSRFR
ncbi:hypothetical protein KI387_003537, partial [Taxus chinensis]